VHTFRRGRQFIVATVVAALAVISSPGLSYGVTITQLGVQGQNCKAFQYVTLCEWMNEQVYGGVPNGQGQYMSGASIASSYSGVQLQIVTIQTWRESVWTGIWDGPSTPTSPVYGYGYVSFGNVWHSCFNPYSVVKTWAQFAYRLPGSSSWVYIAQESIPVQVPYCV
jgi:hypothetical protein